MSFGPSLDSSAILFDELGRNNNRMLEWAGWPLLWCVLGIVVTGYPTLLSGFADVQGGLGDPLLVNFTLEHSFRWMTGMPLAADLWLPPIFYPTRGVANYTDLLLGVAPLYWPWRWLDLGPHTAYQLWMFACWTANFIVFFLLLKRGFQVSVFAASAGAALFAFGSPRTANIMHQQLVSQFYLALVLLAAIELIRSSNRGCWSVKSWLWTATFFFGPGVAVSNRRLSTRFCLSCFTRCSPRSLPFALVPRRAD